MDGEVAELNMDSAVESLGNDLFPSGEPVESEPESESAEAAPVEAQTQPVETTPAVKTEEAAAPVAATPEPVPASFRKDLAHVWEKIPAEAQTYYIQREKQMLNGLEQYKAEANYGRTLRDAIAPYRQYIPQGVPEEIATRNLYEAHRMLTQGSPEQRRVAYEKLGQDLQIPQRDPNAAPVDPKLQSLEQRMEQYESEREQARQLTYTQAREKSAAELDAFIKEHPDFDDVSNEVLNLVKLGKSLQDAYNDARWLNPVARQKEVSRLQTEATEKLKENARLEALPKNKAKSVNVRSRDTGRAPTEPLGSWEDTMQATMAEIKSRSH